MSEWRTVIGYEGLYEVSNTGFVRSLARATTAGKMLALNIEPGRATKYRYVFLCKHGKATRFRVHTLVLTAFIGPRPHGNVARHLNSDPSDNNIVNLSWGTPKENMADEYARGCSPLRNFKLSIEDVQRIKRLRGKMSQQAIASDYGVSQGAIHLIHSGKTWRHV